MVVVALFVAACGATVPPSPTLRPIVTATPATPAPSSPPFQAGDYPVAGDAPCGQAKPPDAAHAAYTGNLKRISAKDPSTVVFTLCAPDVAFLSKIARPAFAINDTGWLAAHIGPASGAAQPIVSAVNGTGPYRLERWDRGSEISLARNDTYWGEPAKNERVIVRWDQRSAQRASELQGATVDGIDDIAPADVAAIGDDVGLQLLPRPGLETFYVGLSGTGQFGDERVRRALAMGIDREKLTESFFPPGSVVASQYTPCAIPNGCAGDPWYEFDPTQAKELLAASGLQDGFDTTIHYPDAPTAGIPTRPASPRLCRASSSTTWGSVRRSWPNRRPHTSPISMPESSTGSTCPGRRTVSGRERLPGSALRAECLEGARQALRRHRQGPRDRTSDDQRGPADGRLQDGQQPDPGPRADDPDRGRGVLGGASGPTSMGRACRRCGSSASPT